MNNGNEGFENLKEIESLKKEIDLVREEAQVEQLKLQKAISHLHENIKMKDDRIRELEHIGKEHQKINSELRTDVNNMTEMCKKYKDEIKSIELGTVNNFRRKGVL
jgi:DNA repair exonuclease SbcCD ATPase subunit